MSYLVMLMVQTFSVYWRLSKDLTRPEEECKSVGCRRRATVPHHDSFGKVAIIRPVQVA
jgi:hypothetical protein